MRLLVDVEPNAKATVRKIDGGEEIKKHLDDLGVKEGVEFTVFEQVSRHEHRGAVSLRVDGSGVILGHGMAEKVYVEREGNISPVLRMEKGDRGIVKAFGGGKDFVGWLSSLGIEVEKEIEFLRHLPDDTLSFEVEGKSVTMGEGQASKVLAEQEGKTLQTNYLERGKKATVSSVIGGPSLKEKLEAEGIKEGVEITLSKREETPPAPARGKYVRAETGGRDITIGYGMAKKIWVD